ncbi:MAG: hypothetical protein M1817_001099 [Caeruleum heppii]|nr:MAG: hypothetical protein M1817_001099 [Caeruleum heppii]
MLVLTPRELKRRAQHIRDVLGPAVATAGELALTGHSLVDLTVFLIHLEKTNVDAELLRCTGIHKALAEIAADESRWPAGPAEMSRKLLRNWQLRFGPLDEIRALLWARGGRMERCRRMKSRVIRSQSSETAVTSGRTPKRWMVEGLRGHQAESYGNNGFEVGLWWIKAACAYRDGMLGDPNGHITPGDYGASAVVLTAGTETETTTETTLWKVKTGDVRVSPSGRGVLCLMANMHNHSEIRVLRSWKLRSVYAPKAGLRYDGLYSIVGFGIKRFGPITYYNIEMKRFPDQRDMKDSMEHPTSAEMDDWLDYRHYRDDQKAATKAAQRASLMVLDGEADSADVEADWLTEEEYTEEETHRIEGAVTRSRKDGRTESGSWCSVGGEDGLLDRATTAKWGSNERDGVLGQTEYTDDERADRIETRDSMNSEASSSVAGSSSRSTTLGGHTSTMEHPFREDMAGGGEQALRATVARDSGYSET